MQQFEQLFECGEQLQRPVVAVCAEPVDENERQTLIPDRIRRAEHGALVDDEHAGEFVRIDRGELCEELIRVLNRRDPDGLKKFEELCSQLPGEFLQFHKKPLKTFHVLATEHRFADGGKCHGSFAALFGSPIAGCLFGLTFATPDTIRLSAMLPSVIASFTAVWFSSLLGVHVMEIPHFTELPFTWENAIIVALFALAVGVGARFFIILLEKFKERTERAFRSAYTRAVVPAVMVMVLLFAIYAATGTNKYAGLSIALLYDAINGDTAIYAFALNALTIFLSISAGFVGGEVVPLLVTGGTFGFTVATIAGLPTPAFAVLGAVGMLAGGTNLPVVCFALGLELFGYNEPMLLFIATAIAYATSGKHSIYQHQRQVFYRQFR